MMYIPGMKRETPKERRQRERRTKALLKTPRTFDVILSHVRNGGSLIDLCETWDVRYSDFIGWIREDRAPSGRSARYDEAGRDRSEWTDEVILSELRARLRFDPRRLYNAEGYPIAIHKLDPDVARMIEEVKADGSIKFFGKKEALELAAKNRRLLIDKTELSVDRKLEDILSASYETSPDSEPDAHRAPGSEAAPPAAPASPQEPPSPSPEAA